jgi:3-dehydroquinate synthase
MKESIEINAGTYSIFIDSISENLESFFQQKKFSKAKYYILVDENSHQFCLPHIMNYISAFSEAEIIEIESGEANKTIQTCIDLWSVLSELGADRNAILINLGGGVISDIGGFVAGTYLRGIGFINIPTTLLSQVDASVGGKVGVNQEKIKNKIGLFNNPMAVFIDTAFLNTLPKRQILSGLGEIIKHALIADSELWNKIKYVKFDNLNKLKSIILKSVEIKNAIVKQDSKEKNVRKKLNFGHTIGHAIESFSMEGSGKTLLHGEAIGIGIICECYISFRKEFITEQILTEITSFIFGIFERYKLTTTDFHRIIELMKFDKKNEFGILNFTLLKDIGEATINNQVGVELILESLDYYCNLR